MLVLLSLYSSGSQAVVCDIADLSGYGVGTANNGGGSDGEEFAFPASAGGASAGDFLYIATEAEQFKSFFGFGPDYTSNAMLINGDDAIELYCGGVVCDVYGEPDQAGGGKCSCCFALLMVVMVVTVVMMVMVVMVVRW